MGGNSKTSTGTESSPFAPLIAKFAKSFLPGAKLFGKQQAEALKTGGVNAQIPIINRAVDASRGAESAANVSTQEALARAGLANTSFGAQILGSQRMSGAQATAEIPTNIAGQFISSVPQTAGIGVGAGIGAANANRTMTQTPSWWDLFSQGLRVGGGSDAATAFGASQAGGGAGGGP